MLSSLERGGIDEKTFCIDFGFAYALCLRSSGTAVITDSEGNITEIDISDYVFKP